MPAEAVFLLSTHLLQRRALHATIPCKIKRFREEREQSLSSLFVLPSVNNDRRWIFLPVPAFDHRPKRICLLPVSQAHAKTGSSTGLLPVCKPGRRGFLFSFSRYPMICRSETAYERKASVGGLCGEIATGPAGPRNDIRGTQRTVPCVPQRDQGPARRRERCPHRSGHCLRQ